MLSAPSGGPHTLTLGPSGPFAHVINLSFPNQPIEIPFDPDSTTDVPIVFDDANSLVENRDAFYWAMTGHDFIRNVDPAFSALDYPMYLITDYPDQQCNAFWDGYGLGLALDSNDDRPMWGHGGDGFGTHTEFWHLPRERLTIAMTWNDDVLDREGRILPTLLRAALAYRK